jgi:hypothetical protein
MHRKRRFLLEARCTQMRLLHSIKKSSTAQTKGGLVGFYVLPTVVAENSFLRRFKISRAQSAIRREEN